MRRTRASRLSALAIGAVCASMAGLAGCTAGGSSKAGGAPVEAGDGVVTLRFASGELRPFDQVFQRAVARRSGGRLRLVIVRYNTGSPATDDTLARDLEAGRLDVADVASRVWESHGVDGFQVFQEPFLISSRALLDRAVTAVAPRLLRNLSKHGITGFAIVPRSVRYVFSKRPLTSPRQFRGMRIRISPSPTTERALRALGAQPVSTLQSGPDVVVALRTGAIDAVESDMQLATINGYVRAAPYVLAAAPLFVKTTTLAASAARLRKLDARAPEWLAGAAADAAAAATLAGEGDRFAWGAACGQGLRALESKPAAIDALRLAERGVARRLAGNSATVFALDQIGLLATQAPRRDAWETCHAAAAHVSPTAVIDGVYASGGSILRIRDGRYAITRAGEAGSVSVAAGRAMLISDAGVAPSTYQVESSGRELRWQFVSGRRGPAILTRSVWLRTG
jgi:TRAP-type C4-dicarboxylate transport system substrate-binding protein